MNKTMILLCNLYANRKITREQFVQSFRYQQYKLGVFNRKSQSYLVGLNNFMEGPKC